MSENMALVKFMDKRKNLIQCLERKKINKNEFLEQLHLLIMQSGVKPFKSIQEVEEGLYNYQFYNSMAKQAFQRAKVTANKRKRQLYLDKCKNYYTAKDYATKKVVERISKKDIEAYYVITNSNRLTLSLFEINIKNIPFTILHSMDIDILNLLKEKEVFHVQPRKSIIHDYINNLY